MVQQFIAGMNSCGQMWEMVVVMNCREFLPLFTNATQIEWHQDFLHNILESTGQQPQRTGGRDCLPVGVLADVHSSMCLSRRGHGYFLWGVAGLWQGPILSLLLGSRRNASLTSIIRKMGAAAFLIHSLCLFLPRGVTEEEEFRRLMFLTLKGSFVFGKVWGRTKMHSYHGM